MAIAADTRFGFHGPSARLATLLAIWQRKLERGRGVAGPGLAEQLGFGPYLMDPIGFVMSKKMLRTLKRLAETSQR